MPSSLRFKLELIKRYLSKYKFILLLSLFFGSILAYQSNRIQDFFSRPYFVTEFIGQIGQYSQDIPEDISEKISYGLTAEDKQGNFIPSIIVESIQQDSQGKTYEFKLKPNIFWHNGKPLSPQDLKSELLNLDIQIKSDQVFQIHLTQPNISFLSSLSKPILKNKTIGLGPRKIDKIIYQNGFIKKIELKSLRPELTNQTYIFYQNTKDLILGLKLAEVDQIVNLSSTEGIPTWDNIKINPSTQTDRYVAIFINTQKFDKKTRQALSYSTPEIETKSQKVLTPINPDSWAYTNQVKQYNYDEKRAKELLKGSGLSSLSILVASRNLIPTAEFIKRAWQDSLKIKVDIATLNQSNIEDYDMILTYAQIPQDPDQYKFWHSTQLSTNITKLENAKIDKLLEAARLSINQSERKNLYIEFQKSLAEEAPAIFLFYPTIYNLSRVQ